MRRSNRQDKWSKRAAILWRLKGSYISYLSEEGILTNEEKGLIRMINDLRQNLIKRSVLSSRILGFNAHYRCSICNKPISDETYNNPEEADLCINCKENE